MANLGSGLDAQIGIGVETTYGTAVALTRFTEFDSESVKRVKHTVQGTGLRGGGFVAESARRLVAWREAHGNLTMDATSSGQLAFWKQSLGVGATPTPVAGVSTWVFTIGALRGQSMTMQIGRPSVDGTVNPFTYVGGKIEDLTFSIADNTLAKLALTMDFADELTAVTTPAGPTLATASYPTSNQVFSLTGVAFTLGGSNIAAVKKADVKFTNPFDKGRVYLGSGGVKAEPINNGWRGVTGSLDAEFVSRTALFDAYQTDASVALVLTVTGNAYIPTTTTYPSIQISLPVVKLDGETPVAPGPGILRQTVPFTALDTGATVTIVTGDATI